MSEANTKKNPHRLAWQRFSGLLLIVGACLMLFRPPVTWNEIFQLASLKRTGVTIDLSETAAQHSTTQTTLVLQKPIYSAEWFDSLVRTLSDSLQGLAPSLWPSIIGQSDSVALRLFCLLLAMTAFLIFNMRPANQSRAPDLQRVTLQTAVIIPLLLLFVRWGAAEQLFVLIALAALARTAPAASKLNVDRNRSLCWLTVTAGAMACANSRTWIYSLAPAILLWIALQPTKSQLIKQTLFASGVFAAAFLGLFMTDGSFETLVSHLTHRWLHLNEPRYLSLAWPGAVLPWKILCAWLGLLNLRRLASASATQSITSRDHFSQLLIISATVQLCHFQKTPAASDVLLLILMTVHQTPQVRHQTKTLFLNLANSLLWVFAVGLACALLISIILLLSPTTRTVPDLAATALGFERLWKSFPTLCLSTLFFTLTAAYLLFGAVRSRATGDNTRATHLGHFALCSLVAFLYCASELRSRFIWHALKSSIATIPQQTQLFYLPQLEPLIQLMPQTPHRKRMAGIYQGESVLQEEQRSILLIPVEVSEVCQSAGWNVETTHGIFALCDTGQGEISHLLPMN